MKVIKSLLAVLVGGAMVAPVAMAQEGPWMVRVRALNMQVDNGNSPEVAGAKVSINDKTFPEIDIAYSFTPSISAELVLTYPQKHDVSLQGNRIGSIKHLPPALMLQYHFAPGADLNPYVGAGVNYTRFMSAKLPDGISTDKGSFGGALQVGLDFKLAQNLYLNLDYKYVNIETDVKAGGSKLTTLKVDPNLISVGLGWRF